MGKFVRVPPAMIHGAAINGTGGAVIAHQQYAEIGAMGGGDGRRFYFAASPSSSFMASSIARMVA